MANSQSPAKGYVNNPIHLNASFVLLLHRVYYNIHTHIYKKNTAINNNQAGISSPDLPTDCDFTHILKQPSHPPAPQSK